MTPLAPTPPSPRLGGDLTIRSIRGLTERLRQVVEAGETEVDCADVRSADTAALQVILVWRRHARQRGTELRFTHPSRALLDAATLAGVAAEALNVGDSDEPRSTEGTK